MLLAVLKSARNIAVSEMNKKGVTLSINTIVIIILAIIALIITVLIFSGAARQFAAAIMARLRAALGMWNATNATRIP